MVISSVALRHKTKKASLFLERFILTSVESTAESSNFLEDDIQLINYKKKLFLIYLRTRLLSLNKQHYSH